MSDAEEVQPTPGKKRRLMLVLIMVGALGLGAGAFFYFQGSLFGTKAKGKKAKATDENADSADGASTDEASAADGEETTAKDSALPDDSKVKQVIELQPFIVNLADKGEARYLRLTISIGIGGEEKGEEKADPLFTARVRNALMSVMTAKTSDEVLSVDGKNTLRKELLQAAKSVSKTPKVYAIYITDFIVQL